MRKKLNKPLMGILLILGLLLATTPVIAEPLYVTSTSLNLRSQPSTSASVIFTMANQTTCTYLNQSQNGFLKVQVWNPNNRSMAQGWASINYLIAAKVADNQSGSQKYIYDSSLTDTGDRVPANSFCVLEAYGGSWLNLPCYSLSNADYTGFNAYYNNGTWYYRPSTQYVYGRYRTSSPSNYWFILS